MSLRSGNLPNNFNIETLINHVRTKYIKSVIPTFCKEVRADVANKRSPWKTMNCSPGSLWQVERASSINKENGKDNLMSMLA
mmetsp:Transcript_11160/g.37917  ORF Transcript_11160/g.37917 Transcript_11160/m.37917 type:complete len:82 (-) Transcript_11160:942-1187(-)